MNKKVFSLSLITLGLVACSFTAPAVEGACAGGDFLLTDADRNSLINNSNGVHFLTPLKDVLFRPEIANNGVAIHILGERILITNQATNKWVDAKYEPPVILMRQISNNLIVNAIDLELPTTFTKFEYCFDPNTQIYYSRQMRK
ncbi:hypothetical protein HZB69_00930 [Candidatus Amesbacteria bacterium]|nr:hypothetical protein [Candidatus Amesbacteria bacterium]